MTRSTLSWAGPLGLLVILWTSQAQVVPRSAERTPQSWGVFHIHRELMVEPGRHGRHRMIPMRPRFITIHSTANKAPSANAERHATALKNGALKSSHNSLGFLTWHYSVDEKSIYQSLPDNERGQHADYEGQGNRESIGIELCENRGNNAQQTIDRTAKLAAVLMKRHRIPLKNVVPHQHWRRIRFDDQKDLGFKNCPGLLLEKGKLGTKWKAFLVAAKRYHAQL